MLKNLIKGVLLIAILWLVNVFIAFVIFKPIDEHTLPINISWLVADIGLLFALARLRYLSWGTGIFALLAILALVIFYLVPLNSNIPQQARELNARLSEESDKYQYAKNLFYEIEKQWTSPTRQYLLEPHKVFFIRDFAYFWNSSGYVDSSIQAQIYERLLIASGRFNENEVLMKQKWCVNSPHGVILIKHEERDIYADFWAVDGFPREGIQEEYRFGQYTIRPCDKLVGEPF